METTAGPRGALPRIRRIPSQAETRLENQEPAGLLVINGAVFVFGWAIPHLGMFIALPLLVIGSAAAGNEFHWKDAIINSIVLTVGSWFIFIWGLKLTIPLYPWFMA